MNDEERQLWKSIVHKASSDEKLFLYDIMDYIQRKAIHENMYYLYILTNNVKTIIENEAIDSLQEKMEERDYINIDPEEYFD